MTAIAVEFEDVKLLVKIAKLSTKVMGMLEEHGPSIVPHLIDTDQNAGQRLRDALVELDSRCKADAKRLGAEEIQRQIKLMEELDKAK